MAVKKRIKKAPKLKKKGKQNSVSHQPLVFEFIESKILIVRGLKVMLDRDLAELYGVPTKVLNQAVKRNLHRFPEDFMLIFSEEETDWWRSQIVTSGNVKRGIRRPPLAFTEQGIAMLSSVLNSERAIAVNIQIMRTFIRLRDYLRENKELRRKIEALENKYDDQFVAIFDAIKKILQYQKEDSDPSREIGFKVK